MAKQVDPSASYMSLPKGITRGNPTPVDKTLVWSSEAELREYAKNVSETATSYVGQILSLVSNGKATAYVIKDTSGTLEKLPFESEISGSIGPISGDVTELVRSVSTISGNLGILASGVDILSGDAASADESLAQSIRTLDGELTAAISDESVRAISAEDRKIDKDKIVASLNATSTDDTVPGAKATYQFVNSSIINLAAFYLTKNAAGDAFATKAELNAAIASGNFYNGGEKVVPKKNDYTIVQEDESHSSKSNPTTRYIFDGTNWAFQYIVNNTTFTAAQLAAINSTITETKLGSITGSIAELESSSSVITSLSSAVGSVSGSVLTLSGLAQNADDDMSDKISSLSGAIESILPAIASLQQTVASLSGVYLSRFFTEDDTVVDPYIYAYPSNGISLTNGEGGAEAGEFEVGTRFTPFYSVSYADGKFKCVDTVTNAGCSASSYSVADSSGNTASSKTGMIASQFIVGDCTTDTSGNPVGIANYHVSAKTSYGVSNKAKNSKGEESSLVIPAGNTAIVSSTRVKGIRYMFWGMDAGTGTVDSATIRALGTDYPEHKKKPVAETLPVLEASTKANAKRCIVAIPGKSPLNLTKVTMPVTMDFPITNLFNGPTNVRVEGLSGYPAIDYKVWVYQPDELDPTENYKITIG